MTLTYRALPLAAGVLAVSYLLGTGIAQAQTGTVARALSDNARGSARSGPLQSRLPLTTTDVMPIGGHTAAPVPPGTPGAVSSGGEMVPQAIGSRPEQWPYSTARVAVQTLGKSKLTEQVPVTSFPFRATGKLLMRFGGSWFICTASLIKKGVLITAAHCIHNFGEGNAGFADEVWFAPANTQFDVLPPTVTEGQPYGWYQGRKLRIFNSYRVGTDTCLTSANGIVCNNDIATVLLKPKRDVYAGQVVGMYGYGTNGFSFVQSPAFGNTTVGEITQFGYPGAIDNGEQMIRNDSLGKFIQTPGNMTTTGQQLLNTQLGSAMTGGSSGGPWLVNFGTRPSVGGGASLGSMNTSNVVVGVTSWGYVAVGSNVQGASWFGQNFEAPLADYGGFGAGNIGKLVQDTCTADPAYC